MRRCPLIFFCLPSEAAPYLPAEEKSPLFSIQREGIEDDGVLYRVNRSVEECREGLPGWWVPCLGQVVAPRAVVPAGPRDRRSPRGSRSGSGLSSRPVQRALGSPRARALCQLGTPLPGPCPPTPAGPALAQCPYPHPRWQVRLPAAPRGTPGRLLLRGRPRVGDGVVPVPGGLGGLSVRGCLLPREHGGDAQRGRAPRGTCAPAALGPGHAAAGAGVSDPAGGCPAPRDGLVPLVPPWLSWG